MLFNNFPAIAELHGPKLLSIQTKTIYTSAPPPSEGALKVNLCLLTRLNPFGRS